MKKRNISKLSCQRHHGYGSTTATSYYVCGTKAIQQEQSQMEEAHRLNKLFFGKGCEAI